MKDTESNCYQPLTIFLIRHGESEQNVGLANGKFDADIELTDLGTKQAEAVALQLNHYVLKENMDLSAARFWTSPYTRALQTTSIINERLRIKNVFEDPRLVEQDFGIWDGIPFEQWEEIAPLEYAQYMKRYRSERGKFFAKAAGGESPFDVYNRVSTFLDTLMRDAEHGYIYVFITCHGITMRCFAARFLHMGIQWYFSTPNPVNCSVWMIQKEDNMYRLEMDFLNE